MYGYPIYKYSGAQSTEIICSECTRGRDNADKPFTCRRCNIGVSSAQPFICRRCINTNPDINSCDGVATEIGDNASKEQRLAELRRLFIEKFRIEKNVDWKVGNYQHYNINQLNKKINYYKNKKCLEWN